MHIQNDIPYTKTYIACNKQLTDNIGRIADLFRIHESSGVVCDDTCAAVEEILRNSKLPHMTESHSMEFSWNSVV